MKLKKEVFIHFHGSSFGEVGSALKLIDCLESCYSKEFKFEYFITYVSESTRVLLVNQDRNKHVKNFERYRFLNGELRKFIQKKITKKDYFKVAFITIEKDRPPFLLRMYKKISNSLIINIEAKKPVGLLSQLYFKLFNDSKFYDSFFFENDYYRQEFLDFFKVPKSKTFLGGTLKAVPSIKNLKKMSKKSNTILYISSKYNDLPIIINLINKLKLTNYVTYNHVILPRYTRNSIDYRKSYKSFRNKLKKNLDINEVSSFEKYLDVKDDFGVFLIENMGQTDKFINVARFAVVCGTFRNGDKGHNIYEPLIQSIPTFIGENYINWENSVKSLKKEEGLLITSDYEKLDSKIINLSENIDFYNIQIKTIENSKIIKKLKSSDNTISEILMKQISDN